MEMLDVRDRRNGRMLHTWDLPSQVCGFAVHLSWISIHAVIKTCERTIFSKARPYFLDKLISFTSFFPSFITVYICIYIRTVGSYMPAGEKMLECQ